jgi:hypothetical protein
MELLPKNSYFIKAFEDGMMDEEMFIIVLKRENVYYFKDQALVNLVTLFSNKPT